MEEVIEHFNKKFEFNDGIYSQSDSNGYWSNFSKDDQDRLFILLKDKLPNEVIKENFNQYYDMIYNTARCVGLEILKIDKNDIGIDYGCMWGNILVYCARMCKAMIGVDQTIDSLKFLRYRLKEEKLDNCLLLNANLRNKIDLHDKFDFSIINGVLEWVPDKNEIDLKDHFKKGRLRFEKPQNNPRLEQLEFLKMVNGNLRDNGKLYLAIENRLDYQHFLWKKDPHSNLMYTAFLPRFLSNLLSNILYGRSYVNYIYSQRGLKKLLIEANFRINTVYAVFPDYRFPQKIIATTNNKNNDYKPVYNLGNRNDLIARVFKKGRKLLDIIIYKKLKLFSLAPSFIVIAEK